MTITGFGTLTTGASRVAPSTLDRTAAAARAYQATTPVIQPKQEDQPARVAFSAEAKTAAATAAIQTTAVQSGVALPPALAAKFGGFKTNFDNAKREGTQSTQEPDGFKAGTTKVASAFTKIPPSSYRSGEEVDQAA